MEPNDIIREAALSLLKEGIRSGFNFLTTSLTRRREDKSKDMVAEEQAEEVIEPTVGAEPTPADAAISWDKPATLFWLGNDLMWVQDQVYRGSLPPRVLQGVENAIGYCRDLGFGQDSLPIQNLELAKAHLKLLPDVILDGDTLAMVQQQYRSIEKLVKQVKFFVQGIAQSEEPGFVKRRAFLSQS